MSRFAGLTEKLTDTTKGKMVPMEPAALPSPAPARRPAREGKKFIGGWYSKELSRELGRLALDNDTTVQALMGEAIDLLLRQYGKHPYGER